MNILDLKMLGRCCQYLGLGTPRRPGTWTIHLAWILILLSSVATAQPTAPYPGYRQPWQAPPGQWNFAPPNQRQPGTPSPMPTSPNPQYPYSGGWPMQQQSAYGQNNYYAPSAEPPHLEVRISGSSPYVQENLLLWLDLYSKQNLKTATPQFPQTDTLVFQKIEGPSVASRSYQGSQKILTRFIYQVTPLRPGRIEIPPIHVTGEQESAAGYARTSEFDAVSSGDLVLNVKPADPGSSPWLPLEQLNLKSHLPEKLKAVAGKPLSLTIEMNAVGASGNLLPSLERQLQNDAFRVYRDKTRTTTKLDRKGNKIIGRRIDTFTLVPQYGGDLHLPDLRLSWWNTKNDTPQYTSVPIKPIEVSGSGFRGGDGMFGLTETSTLFPAGSPAAFWIPVSVIFGVIFGYWLAVWLSNRRKKEIPIPAFAPLTNAMKRPFKYMAPAFAPLGEKFRSTTAILNPVNRWQKLRRQAIGMLPLSIRFWFCVRLVEQEDDPDVWGYTLRFLANKHLNMPARAPFSDIGNRILQFHPKADPIKIRKLIHALDQSLYGHSDLDFEQWKAEFKHEIRPRLKLLPGFGDRQLSHRQRLPELNPLPGR
ncbi:MAG: hypothetical protein PVG22_04060 [Chromatiales bacterium]